MTDDPRAAAFERDTVLDAIVADLKYQYGPYCDEARAIQLLRIHVRSAEAEIERLKAAPPAEGPTTECCGEPLQADVRFCPKCGYEARATPPRDPAGKE